MKKEDYLKIDIQRDDATALNIYMKEFRHKYVVEEICEILLKKDLSYIEMNAVLWRADEVLRYKAIHEKLQS